MNSEKILKYTAEVCRKSGADEWEIASIESRLLSVEAKDGGVEAFEVASSLGIAVRVRVGDRPGFSYSAECSDNALSLMVDSAMAGARAADADPQSAFADPGGILPDLNLWDSAFENIGKDQKIAQAFAIEEEAKKYDRRIARVRSAVYGEGSQLIRIINSRGLNREARANGCSASLMAVAEENGESQMGWDHAYSEPGKSLMSGPSQEAPLPTPLICWEQKRSLPSRRRSSCAIPQRQNSLRFSGILSSASRWPRAKACSSGNWAKRYFRNS